MNELFSKNILDLVRQAIRIGGGRTGFTIYLMRYQKHFRKAMKLRKRNGHKGVHVPPIMIFSITRSCNLKCRGCYARARIREDEKNLESSRIREIIQEASELGVSIILIAGGEPLLNSDIIGIAGDFPSMLFPLFTNGTLIDDSVLCSFGKHRNIIPVLSLDGPQAATDFRRGEGIYSSIRKTLSRMNGRGLFYGTSITLTKNNFHLLSDEDFIGDLVGAGCRIIFLVEYVPIEEGTEELCLTEEQQKNITPALAGLRNRFPSLFVALPGEEEQYGGCLAAGRGFIHISASGDLEPCPFAPYSDINLSEMTLEEGLRSVFLRSIRENHWKLTESRGGCALWENRDWVESVLTESDSNREQGMK